MPIGSAAMLPEVICNFDTDHSVNSVRSLMEAHDLGQCPHTEIVETDNGVKVIGLFAGPCSGHYLAQISPLPKRWCFSRRNVGVYVIATREFGEGDTYPLFLTASVHNEGRAVIYFGDRVAGQGTNKCVFGGDVLCLPAPQGLASISMDWTAASLRIMKSTTSGLVPLRVQTKIGRKINEGRRILLDFVVQAHVDPLLIGAEGAIDQMDDLNSIVAAESVKILLNEAWNFAKTELLPMLRHDNNGIQVLNLNGPVGVPVGSDGIQSIRAAVTETKANWKEFNGLLVRAEVAKLTSLLHKKAAIIKLTERPAETIGTFQLLAEESRIDEEIRLSVSSITGWLQKAGLVIESSEISSDQI